MRSKLAILLVGVAACLVAALIIGSLGSAPMVSVSVPQAQGSLSRPSTLIVNFMVTNHDSREIRILKGSAEKKTSSGWVPVDYLFTDGAIYPRGSIPGRTATNFMSEILTQKHPAYPTRIRLMIAIKASPLRALIFSIQRALAHLKARRSFSPFWVQDLYWSQEVVTPEIAVEPN